MTITLPNPFIDSLSVGRLPPADQLTAHVDHAAVLSTPASPAEAGVCQEAVSSFGQAGAAASTLSCLEPLTVAWVFGCIREELAAGLDEINSHTAFRKRASNSIVSA